MKRKLFELKTDVIVLIRSVCELIVLGVVAFLLLRLILSPNRYVPLRQERPKYGVGRGQGLYLRLLFRDRPHRDKDTLVSIRKPLKNSSARLNRLAM